MQIVPVHLAGPVRGRAQDNDARRRRGAQQRQKLDGEEDRRNDVDGERQLQPVRTLLPRRAVHAGVGDQDVEARPVTEHIRRQAADAADRAEVGQVQRRRGPGRGCGVHGRERGLSAARIAAVHEDVRAESCQLHGGLEADAARRAGDQHRASVHAAPRCPQPRQRRPLRGRRGVVHLDLPSSSCRRPRLPAAFSGHSASRRARAREPRSHHDRHDPQRSAAHHPLVAPRPAARRQSRARHRRGDRARARRPAAAPLRLGAARAPRLGAGRRGALVALALAAQPGRRPASPRLAAAPRTRRPRGPRARARRTDLRRRRRLGRRTRARRDRRRRGPGRGSACPRDRRDARAPVQPARRTAQRAHARGPPVHRVHAVLARPPRGRRARGAAPRAGHAACCARRPGRPLSRRTRRRRPSGRGRRSSPPSGGRARPEPRRASSASSTGRSPGTPPSATARTWRGALGSRRTSAGAS